MPVETLILCVILQKNQLNLMGLIYAMHSNGPLPQVCFCIIGAYIFFISGKGGGSQRGNHIVSILTSANPFYQGALGDLASKSKGTMAK